jgi:rhodanese-related sulfurtransferase
VARRGAAGGKLGKEETVGGANIDTKTLMGVLERGQPVTVLDLRKAEDRAEWRIPGSVPFDANDALKAKDPSAKEEAKLPKGLRVVTVCGAGNSSRTAAEQLRARGYEAMSLEGGMQAWSMAWNTAEVDLPGAQARVVQVRRTGKG